MRSLSFAVFAALLALAPIARGATAAADTDFRAFTALTEKRPADGGGFIAFITWMDAHYQEVTKAGLAFYRDHPEDPRRWDVVNTFTRTPPFFITSYGPNAEEKGFADVVHDQQALTAWAEQAEKLWTELAAASDSTSDQKQDASFARFFNHSLKVQRELMTGVRTDLRAAWEELSAHFVDHVNRFAGHPTLSQRAGSFIQAWKRRVPGSETLLWQRLAKSADPAIRDLARRQLAMADGRPMELAFTAVDGREVNLEKLRGKVVLVDFWATWCGPCVMELPNVKAVYAKYRDRGFEVIGITLENADLRPTDSAEQSAAKLGAARQKLLDFVAKENISWPQHFDGKFWKNEFGTKFGIGSVPAMFLLDQEGRVATTEARGEKLEAEVKRLLGL